MIPAFIISLKEETARREAMSKHLAELGIEASYLDAVDGRPMNVLEHPNYAGRRRMAAHGRHLKPGELGCMLSHRAAYQKILDEGHEHVLLLEDDARLHEDTKAALESILAKKIPYDIVRLLGSAKVAKGKHRKIIPLYKDFWLVRLRTNPGGTHATLISRSGAEKLLKVTEKFSFPIDTTMGRSWEAGMQSYSIQPGLAIQDMSFESAIGDERFNKDESPKSLSFTLTRAAFKAEEALGKAWTYYANAPKDLATNKKFG